MIEKLENEPFKFGRAAAKLFDELNAAIDELNQREEAIDKRRIALTRAAAGRPLKSAESDAMIDLTPKNNRCFRSNWNCASVCGMSGFTF